MNLIHLFSARTPLYVKISQQRLSTQPHYTCSVLIRHTAPVDTPFCSCHPKHTRTCSHTITDDTLNDSSVGVKCGFHEPKWPLISIFTGLHPLLVLIFLSTVYCFLYPRPFSTWCHKINASTSIFDTYYYKKRNGNGPGVIFGLLPKGGLKKKKKRLCLITICFYGLLGLET